MDWTDCADFVRRITWFAGREIVAELPQRLSFPAQLGQLAELLILCPHQIYAKVDPPQV
jgi:hypothetical protein